MRKIDIMTLKQTTFEVHLMQSRHNLAKSGSRDLKKSCGTALRGAVSELCPVMRAAEVS